MTIWKRLLGIVLYQDIDPVAFMLTTVTTLLGAFLLLPFDSFPASSAFRFLALIGPESFWGMAMLAVGCIHFYALLSDKARVLKNVAFFDVVLWIFISVGLAITNPKGTGTVIYPVLMLGKTWVYLRLIRRKITL